MNIPDSVSRQTVAEEASDFIPLWGCRCCDMDDGEEEQALIGFVPLERHVD